MTTKLRGKKLKEAKEFAAKLNHPYGRIDLNMFRTGGEELFSTNRPYNPAHGQAGSTLVANIGVSYDKGVFEKIVDMVMMTQDAGIHCRMTEIRDSKSAFPMSDTMVMRESAALLGADAGYENICLVDNDVLPEPDLLLRMLKHEMPIMVPIIIEPGVGKSIGFPPQELNQGLQPMEWVTGSFMLFHSTVFNCPIQMAGAITEGILFQRFKHYGHRPWMMTDLELKVTQPPHRPGSLSWEERGDRLKEIYDHRYDPPDRAAIDPDNPYMIDGIYMPWKFPRND